MLHRGRLGAVALLAGLSAPWSAAHGQGVLMPATVTAPVYLPPASPFVAAHPVTSYYVPAAPAPVVSYYAAPPAVAPVAAFVPAPAFPAPVVSYYQVTELQVPATVRRGLFGKTIVRTPFGKLKY